MSIDKDLFARRISELAVDLDKEFSDESIKPIYAIISEQLDTDQFLFACQEISRKDRFPTIKEFVDIGLNGKPTQSTDSPLFNAYQEGFDDGLRKGRDKSTEYYSGEIKRLYLQILELRDGLAQ